MEAIVLVGGRGTRLGELTLDKPKPLLPIRGVPFLHYLLKNLKKKNVTKVVLACGYMASQISEYLLQNQGDFPELVFSVEKELLGTGGAIKQALNYCVDQNVLILNGDSYIDVDFSDLFGSHLINHAGLTLTSLFIKKSDRYGLIQSTGSNKIIGFKEKKKNASGYINAGVYLARVQFLSDVFAMIKNEKFSFEETVLESKFMGENVYHFPVKSYFLDIGVSKDYELAQSTLFLD